MNLILNHFRARSNQLEAERVAYLARLNSLREQIDATATAVAEAEQVGVDASKHRATLRRLKAERAEVKAPVAVDPLPDLEAYARMNKSAEPSPVALKIPPGQTPLAAHNALAEKTNAILAEIARVNATPRAAAETVANIKDQLDSVACAPRIVNGELVFPKTLANSNDGRTVTVIDTAGLFAWLHKDAIVTAIQKVAKAQGPGLTAGERSAALADLYARFANALRLEAAAAMAAEKAQQRVLRRRHVHPAVLLGVKANPADVFKWFNDKRGA
jgi:hypothetical protein